MRKRMTYWMTSASAKWALYIPRYIMLASNNKKQSSSSSSTPPPQLFIMLALCFQSRTYVLDGLILLSDTESHSVNKKRPNSSLKPKRSESAVKTDKSNARTYFFSLNLHPSHQALHHELEFIQLPATTFEMKQKVQSREAGSGWTFVSKFNPTWPVCTVYCLP